MSIRINRDLQCEVDQRKCDCQSEPAHCHITRNGVRVAQVWLNPAMIESGNSLEPSEFGLVISTVLENKYELLTEYHNNSIHGSDT